MGDEQIRMLFSGTPSYRVGSMELEPMTAVLKRTRLPAELTDIVALWFADAVGEPPVALLFERGHLSVVLGLRTLSGARAVLKVRRPSDRLHSCVAVQRGLYDVGFPAPRPLAGPEVFSGWAFTIEDMLSVGDPRGRTEAEPAEFARSLQTLVASAPPVSAVGPLTPHPPWVGWDHEGKALWPPPDDLEVNLDAVDGPAWLDDAAAAARATLLEADLNSVVGHGDWYSGNLMWDGHRLAAVHDWDSVVAHPEAAVCGAASAVFPAVGPPWEPATTEESSAFIDAYAAARGIPLTAEEKRVAWAAGLWVRCFDAKKEAAMGPVRNITRLEAARRLKAAGR